MTTRQRLPNRRTSVVFAFDHDDGQRYRATASRYADGRLAEIFLNVGKAGSTVQQHADDAATLASLLRQNGVSADVIRRSVAGAIAVALDLAVTP